MDKEATFVYLTLLYIMKSIFNFNFTRSLALIFMLVFVGSNIHAQIDPVSWDASLTKLSTGEYELKLTAQTEAKWVIYSQHVDNDGPIPTTFEIKYPKGSKANGEFKEPDNPIVSMDEMFAMELTKYKGPATFTQLITSKAELQEISGEITFMTCDNSRCLPPKTIEFTATVE